MGYARVEIMDEESKKLAEELLFSGDHKPSFAKALFFGIFEGKRVIPFPQVSKDEIDKAENLVVRLKQFMVEKIDPVWIDKNAKIPEEVILGLGKLGILSLTIPKEYGGLGLSQYAYCRAMEELSRRCSATALFVNAHQSVGLKALLLFGTEEQKKKWLPPLGRGEAIAAFSLTEPNAGSDAGGIETKATYDAAQKSWTIKGRKQWTTNGAIAKIITVMAKTKLDNGQEKVTAFLVTPEMPGFKVVVHTLDKTGMRGSITSNIDYDNVVVPEDQILGPLGGGLRVCLTVLDYGRTTFGATCLGVAKECEERAYKYAKERVQFKKPIASFQLVKEKLAKMSAYTYATECTTYLTAGLLDKGQEDVMLESAILKVFASESLWNSLFDTMQIFGGKSFFTDLPFERMMRDARLNTIGEGSNDVLRVFIAAVGLREFGMDLLKHKNNFDIKGALNTLKPILAKPRIKVAKYQFAADRLASQISRFNWACLKAIGKYGEKIADQQLILNRITNMVIALYTSTAVLSKLQEDQSMEVKGLLYLDYATRDFEKAYESLFSKQDYLIEKTADMLLEGL